MPPSLRLEDVGGFADVPGRDTWYAGAALIESKLLGPPLGIRSITATCDGGATWNPTIEIDEDVHEVRAHAARPEIVIAAAATGLCISRDGGATWRSRSQPGIDYWRGE